MTQSQASAASQTEPHGETSHLRRRPVVAVAGARGFIGKHVIPALVGPDTSLSSHPTNTFIDFDVIALSRQGPPDDLLVNTERVQWRRCDLFNLRQIEEALQGATYAVYLVHSMLPHARLSQGHFADIDLILADNFSRAAATCGIQQIIYLGGIVPHEDQHLSEHLASRKEVEYALAARHIPLTTLRAGLILGPGGSSFRLLVKLVERLPIMVCPSWTLSRNQPIAVDDVVQLLRYCVGRPETYHQVFDVAGPEIITYKSLISLTASAMGKRVYIVTLPFFSLAFSKLWLCLITRSPFALVSPLVDSLRHQMLGVNLQWRGLWHRPLTPLKKAIEKSLPEKKEFVKNDPARMTSNPKNIASCYPRYSFAGFSTVRSIQRLPRPQGRDAVWVAQEYARWLPQFLFPWIVIDIGTNRTLSLRLRPLKKPLLVLELALDRSTLDRQLFYIRGGLLAHIHKGARGRLEFRITPCGTAFLAAVHDFLPRLPWFIYKYTQAQLHVLIMGAFSRHLKRISVLSK